MEKQPVRSQKGIQDRFLSEICREKSLVWIYLVSGTRLEGYINAFDPYVIYLEEPVPQIVYKSAVCSVIHARYNKQNALTQKTLDETDR
jgi:RNA chaperone Hfq